MRTDPPDPEDVRPLVDDVHAEAVQALAANWTDDPRDRALRIDWQTVADHDERVAQSILDHPEAAVEAFQRALESHKKLLREAAIRFRNVPDAATYRVGDLRTMHLRTLVAVECEVVDVDPVRPLITEAAFECRICGVVQYTPQTYGNLYKPDECPGCEHGNPGYALIEEKSTLIDHQPVVVTPLESALEEPPAIAVYLHRDLVGTVGEDDELTVVGVYKTLPLSKQGESRLNTYLDASDIDVEEHAQADKLTESDLTDAILAVVEEEDTADGSDWGVDRALIVDRVASEYGVRQTEVEDRLDAMQEDATSDVGISAGRVFHSET